MKQTHLSTPRTLRDCEFTYGSTSGPAAKSTAYSALWWAAISLCCVAAAAVIALTGPAA